MSVLLIINGIDKESKKILFNVMSEHFSTRSHKNNVQPVSFVLEELPRYASPTLDYEKTLAYARQSSYSIIGVIQDYSQLEKFRSSDVDSILNNVTLFQLATQKEPLEKFHYFYNNEIYKFDPQFISKEVLYKSELKYQKDTKQYAEVERQENEIVIYDERLYGIREVVTVVNIDTMEEREVHYDPKSEEEDDGYFLKQYHSARHTSKDEDDMQLDEDEFISDLFSEEEEDEYAVDLEDPNY